MAFLLSCVLVEGVGELQESLAEVETEVVLQAGTGSVGICTAPTFFGTARSF